MAILYSDTVTLFCRIGEGQYVKTCLTGVRLIRKDGVSGGAEAQSEGVLQVYIPVGSVRTLQNRTYVSPENFSPALSSRCYTLRPGQDLLCPGTLSADTPPADAYALTEVQNRSARLPRLTHRRLVCRR